MQIQEEPKPYKAVLCDLGSLKYSELFKATFLMAALCGMFIQESCGIKADTTVFKNGISSSFAAQLKAEG